MNFKAIYEQVKSPSKVVVTYPGRFNPAHKNHYDAYAHLQQKFTPAVYITTSDKVELPKSPLSFEEKKLVWTTMFPVNKDKVVKVKNPYNPVEVLSQYPEDTIWIVGVGEKDADRLTKSKYFKNVAEVEQSEMKGYKEEGYYYIVPLQTMKFDGELVSGTSVRNVFSGDDEQKKQELFKQLYGKMNNEIYDLLVSKIGGK